MLTVSIVIPEGNRIAILLSVIVDESSLTSNKAYITIRYQWDRIVFDAI